MRKPWMRWAVGVPVALVVLASAGTWAYINLIRDDAPDRLTVDTGAGPSTTAAGAGTDYADYGEATAAGGAGSPATTGSAASTGGVEGSWKVTTGSQAGYRVKEVLFGQSSEAVGRTSAVTGQIEVKGTSVSSGSFTVDMTTVTSDESRRDNQFRGRIMDVTTHPTSTFKLTEPIAFGKVPADGEEVKARATGDLTLRGTTRKVTFEVTAKRAGTTIRVAGSIPVVFAEWGIPDPSFGPAQTEDRGELEFLLVLGR